MICVSVIYFPCPCLSAMVNEEENNLPKQERKKGR